MHCMHVWRLERCARDMDTPSLAWLHWPDPDGEIREEHSVPLSSHRSVGRDPFPKVPGKSQDSQQLVNILILSPYLVGWSMLVSVIANRPHNPSEEASSSAVPRWDELFKCPLSQSIVVGIPGSVRA